MEPIQFDFKAKFNGVSLHWKYRPLRKGNGRYIHAGRIPSSQKHGGVLIAGGYRGHYHRPEFGEASVVPYYTCSFGYEIGDRIHMVDTGGYNRICYSPENEFRENNTLHGSSYSSVCQRGFGSGRARIDRMEPGPAVCASPLLNVKAL